MNDETTFSSLIELNISAFPAGLYHVRLEYLEENEIKLIQTHFSRVK